MKLSYTYNAVKLLSLLRDGVYIRDLRKESDLAGAYISKTLIKLESQKLISREAVGNKKYVYLKPQIKDIKTACVHLTEYIESEELFFKSGIKTFLEVGRHEISIRDLRYRDAMNRLIANGWLVPTHGLNVELSDTAYRIYKDMLIIAPIFEL